MEMPNKDLEVTKGVGKVVQELHGMLELVFVIIVATIYMYVDWPLGR